MIFLSLIMPFLAAAGWLWWIHRSDRFEKEPWDLVLKTAGLGAGAGLISLIIHLITRSLGPIEAFLLVPLHLTGITGAMYLLPYRNANWNEPFDGLVYGGAAGIGYGLLYTIGGLAQFALFGFRAAIFSIPVYMLAGLIIGHYLSQVKFSHVPATPRLVRGLVIAGLFLLGIEAMLSLGARVVTGQNMLAGLFAYASNMIAWVFATKAMEEGNQLHQPFGYDQQHIPLSPTGCPHCGWGYPVGSVYCNTCGNPIHQQREA